METGGGRQHSESTRVRRHRTLSLCHTLWKEPTSGLICVCLRGRAVARGPSRQPRSGGPGELRRGKASPRRWSAFRRCTELHSGYSQERRGLRTTTPGLKRLVSSSTSLCAMVRSRRPTGIDSSMARMSQWTWLVTTRWSEALPGRWIPKPALRDRNWWSILAAIEHGVTRRGHYQFMQTIWS